MPTRICYHHVFDYPHHVRSQIDLIFARLGRRAHTMYSDGSRVIRWYWLAHGLTHVTGTLIVNNVCTACLLIGSPALQSVPPPKP